MDFRPDYKSAFDLNFNISECVYETIHRKGSTKRDFVSLTGKKESKISRCFMFGRNFTCKTIAMIQLALGEKIVDIPK